MTTWLVVPAQLSSPLDAVNVLIGSLGESPLTSIDPPPTSEAQEALNVLNEVDLEMQGRGWHWNREDALPLTLATDGTCPLPDQTLRVTSAYWVAQGSGPIDVVQRGNQLYDRVAHSYTFKAAPTVDLIQRLSWDLTPQAYRSYITLEAAQRFQSRKQGSQVVLQINAGDVKQALATIEQSEDEVAQTNSINGNGTIVSSLYGVGGLRRNRAGY